MAPPVLPTDDGSAALLQGARVQSAQALDSQARAGLAQAGFPASAYTPQQSPGPSIQAVGLSTGPGPEAEEQSSGGPSADAQELDWGPTKTPEAPKAKDPPGMFAGTLRELGDAPGRFFSGLGDWLTMGAAGAARVGEAGFDLANGNKVGSTHAASDAIFDFEKKYVHPAIDAWTPKDTGTGAQVIGSVVQALPAMLGETAPAALEQFIMGAGTDGAKDALDNGASLGTAVVNGSIDAISNWVMAKIGFMDKPLMGRLLRAVPAGTVAQVAGQILKSWNYQVGGQDEAAQQSQPTIPGTVTAALETALFSLFGGRAGHTAAEKVAEEPAPPPEGTTPAPAPAAVPTPPEGATPAPPAPATAAPQAAPQPAGATPAATVPDRPTPEPAADLKAQWKDMNDSGTPRTGVFISKGSDTSLVQKGLDQARAQSRTVELPTGTLVLKNKGEAIKAQERFKNGEDPQAIIGDVTGAGSGKTPDQTAVVQGQDDQGNVARESAVTPAEIPGAAAQMAAEGKTPVVTTPEAALQRRAEGVATGEAPPVAPGPGAEAQPLAPEVPGQGVKEATPATDEGVKEPTPELVKERAIIQTGNGERAVIKEGPAVEGKVPVRLIDEEGNPSDQIVHVPETAFAGKNTSPEIPANASGEARGTGSPPEEKIPAEPTSQGAPPEQRSVTPKVQSVLADSRLGETVSVRMSDGTERHGVAVKDAVPGRELPGPAKEMQAPAKEATPKPAESSAPKAEALKIKAKAKREAAAVRREGNEKRRPKVKVIEDVPDETKPKELTVGDKMKLKAAGDRLLKADEKSLEQHRAEVEKILDEVMGPRMSPDDKEVFVANLMSMRREILEKQARRTRRERAPTREEEDEDINQELGAHGVDYSSPDAHDINATHQSDEDWLRDYADKMWGTLGAHLDRTGFTQSLMNRRGLTLKLHDLMDQVIQHTDSPVLRSLYGNVRKYVKNVDVRPVAHVTHPITAEGLSSGTEGLHSWIPSQGIHNIQVKMGATQHPVRILLHEAVHVATVPFVKANPDHPFTKEIENLLEIARRRTLRMHGIPDDAPMSRKIFELRKMITNDRSLYGLTDIKEFMSEAMSTGEFIEHLNKTDAFASPKEKFTRIVHAFGDAIRRFFGIPAGGHEARLFDSILHTTGQIMKEQHDSQMLMKGYLSGTTEASHGLDDLSASIRGLENDERRAIPGEDKIRSVAGNKAADMARQFNRAIRSRAPRALRKLILANETHDQILRSNTHYFDTAGGNPMEHLREAEDERTAVTNRIISRAGQISQRRAQLSRGEDRKLGDLQIQTTSWGIDPNKAEGEQPASVQEQRGFKQRYADIADKWRTLSDSAQQVYNDEWAHNRWADDLNRRHAIDVALDTFSDREITPAQRSALYSARTAGDFDSMIGPGKLIDLGEHNDNLRKSLDEFGALRMRKEGPYFHLGRHGNLVVQVQPEGDRAFDSKAEADQFAEKIRSLSPSSKAKVEELGGKFNVNYKADYVSMHENADEAEAHAARLRAAGFDVGNVTEKVLSSNSVPLTGGVQNLVAEASRRLSRRATEVDPVTGQMKPSADVEALTQALKTSFVQMLASRSAYAASRLARKGTGGVKPEEMGRNFAEHAQSVAWNTAHLATMFKQGEALGKIRELAKEREGVSQKVSYKRGQVMTELGKRLKQDVAQYGQPRSALNNYIAKLGFLNYLASPSHAAIWMTQNFTTAMPVAGARWGYGKALPAFSRAMYTVGGPAFRQAFFEHLKIVPGSDAHFDPNRILDSVVKAVAKDKVLGKWASGDNSHLKQLIERGLVNTSFANELNNMRAGGGMSRGVERVFDYARMLPQMADVFNRVSTGLAGLEMTGGDLAKTLDFVKETHMDYGQENKSRVFKAIGRVPGFNSITMFRTYTQGMAHLLYSNIKNMVYAETKSRAEAAKTVAGMVLATALFTGVIKAAVLEPMRLAVYAYNKLFGDGDEYYDLDNSIRRFVADATGNKAATQAITGGLPRLFGFDLSSRMGLSDLFLHDPPDLLSADKDQMAQFAASLLGPMPQAVSDNYLAARAAWERGDPAGVISAVTPLKALHDAQKAYQLYSTGKQNSVGAQLTQPSIGAAVAQGLGFKPASVADEQERTTTAYGYRQFENQKKQDLIHQYLTAAPEDRKGVVDHINAFRAQNPGEKISWRDMHAAMRSRAMSEAEAAGGQTRDPGLNERLNY